MSNVRAVRLVGLAVAIGVALAACQKANKAPPQRGAPEVGVIVLQPQRIELTALLPGRTVAFRIAQVRPRVNGIIVKRLFTEGANVTAGQPLYELDPAPYKAAYDLAQAAVTKADANALTVGMKYERYQKLAARGDVSLQDKDDVTAAMKQSQADQATARANLESARINLDYTKVRAPISGRTATSAFTEGALVTANQVDVLTTVTQTDPINVDLVQPSADVLRLRQQFADGKLKHADEASAVVKLQIVDDGSQYPMEGKLQFQGITVSDSTGAITLRAVFPNPEGRLLPGMYVRAVLTQGIDEQALVVPQAAIGRDIRGAAVAMTVGPDNKAVQHDVTVAPAGPNQWRVLSGLKAGDRVVVQGLQAARAGSEVKPVVVDPNGVDAGTEAASRGPGGGGPGSAGGPGGPGGARKRNRPS
jgi:membrane fusion protein, multidrug efflux system